MTNVPLRVKLVAAMCLLVAIALGVTGVVATKSLHSYLLDRVDGQLRDVTAGPPDRFDHPHGPGGTPAGNPDPDDNLPNAYFVQHVASDGTPGRITSYQYGTGTDAPKLSGLTSVDVQQRHAAP